MIRKAGVSIIAMSLAAGSAGAQQRPAGGPEATYWVTAATTSGLSARMASTGAMSPSAAASPGMPMGYPPSPPDLGEALGSTAGETVGRALGGRGGAVAGALGSALGGMLGRRAARRGQQPAPPPAAAPAPQAAPAMELNSTRTLALQLGSSRRAAAAPSAEHLPPPGLQAGPSLPLVTPTPSAGTGAGVTGTPSTATPRGRMLIYWGCGDRAAAAPIVIDFANMARSASAFPQIALNLPEPPSAARSATYGEWPNAQSRTAVPPGGSLVGSHTVRGNYTPEIRFDLGAAHDFMAPLNMTGQTPTAAGGTRMTWNAVPGATGYFAYLVGSGGEPDTTVLWTSSATAASFGPLVDYVPPAEARRLVAQRVVMSPQTTECTVPAEVVRAAPSGFVQMTAYGDEVNVSQPRPASAPRAWRPEWTAKVRFKSATSLMLGRNS